jgi:hypothetical protein
MSLFCGLSRSILHFSCWIRTVHGLIQAERKRSNERKSTGLTKVLKTDKIRNIDYQPWILYILQNEFQESQIIFLRKKEHLSKTKYAGSKIVLAIFTSQTGSEKQRQLGRP